MILLAYRHAMQATDVCDLPLVHLDSKKTGWWATCDSGSRHHSTCATSLTPSGTITVVRPSFQKFVAIAATHGIGICGVRSPGIDSGSTNAMGADSRRRS